MGIENLPDIVTVRQLAEFLQIHIETVKRALTSGELKGFKIGNSKDWRIEKESVMNWLKINK